MKHIVVISFCVVLGLFSCRKECSNVDIQKCNESYISNGFCQAYYKRWFYANDINKCIEVEYIGYTARGFTTKQECEICLCNK